jgi:4-amino-4-deoxy-L-arabinose transferase-like glycosyltransferase
MAEGSRERSEAAHPWPRHAAVAGLFLGGAALLFVTHYIVFREARPALWPDTYEYAEVARNVAGGRGLRTDAASVLEIARLGARDIPLPYFVHDPGTSLLLAGVFKLLGPTDTAIGWMSGVSFVLCVPLTYLLAYPLHGRRAAVLAAFLVGLSSTLNGLSVTGLAEVPFAFFLTLSFCLLYRREGFWGRIGVGLALGALVMVRRNALPFLPWFLFFDAFAAPPGSLSREVHGWLGFGRRLGGSILPVLVGFSLLFAPNAIRAQIHTKHPVDGIAFWAPAWLYYTTAMEGKVGDIWSTPGLTVSAWSFFSAHPGELFDKMQWQLEGVFRQLLDSNAPEFACLDAVLFLFLISMLRPAPAGRRERALRHVFYLCVLTAVVIGSAGFLRARHLFGFLPMVLIESAGVVVRALGPRADGERFIGSLRDIAFVVAFGAASLLPVLNSVDEDAREQNRRLKALALFVQQNTPEDALVLVRASPSFPITALAWYGPRQYVWYSELTREAVEASTQRPLFALLATLQAPGREPLQDLGHPPGYHRVAAFRDRPRGVVARLLAAD